MNPGERVSQNPKPLQPITSLAIGQPLLAPVQLDNKAATPNKDVYERHRNKIHEIASDMIKRQDFDPYELVVIRPADLKSK
jgi:hypothetical protein